MDREFGHEKRVVQEVSTKFSELKDRFQNDVTVVHGSKPNKEVGNEVFNEIIDTAVTALIQTKGDPSIMKKLEIEFMRPILLNEDGESMLHGIFRTVVADIATKVAQRSSR